MAIHARPAPIDPYNPTGGDPLRHPSPFIPIRMPVFTPVVWLNDVIIRVISIVGYVGGPRSTSTNTRHRRVPSDSVDSVESAEEGSIPLEPLVRPPPPANSTRIRVSRGTRGGDRRKFD